MYDHNLNTIKFHHQDLERQAKAAFDAESKRPKFLNAPVVAMLALIGLVGAASNLM